MCEQCTDSMRKGEESGEQCAVGKELGFDWLRGGVVYGSVGD